MLCFCDCTRSTTRVPCGVQESVNAKVSETNEWAERFNNGGEAFSQSCAQRCAEYKTCRKEKETQYVKITGPCESGDYAAGNGCVMNREQVRLGFKFGGLEMFDLWVVCVGRIAEMSGRALS
jgi:hypothetical protein